ncbi:unnamed protein product [Lactuca saligna]|uniref:Uncharacterized protein n=1 Tax=Lactuca saligna TaxID=75948 RepID=A0AA35ZVW9_LACSI|nr:unnamed protein product [Lactuca saligna]
MQAIGFAAGNGFSAVNRFTAQRFAVQGFTTQGVYGRERVLLHVIILDLRFEDAHQVIDEMLQRTKSKRRVELSHIIRPKPGYTTSNLLKMNGCKDRTQGEASYLITSSGFFIFVNTLAKFNFLYRGLFVSL